jgi:caffeoyl-CoA O-methyltransferase
MKTENSIQRRRFLQTSGILGATVLFGETTGSLGTAAEAKSKVNKEGVEKLMAELEARGPKFLSVPRKDGQFLNLLIKAARAKNVLEVGTSHGYSALWIASGLEETGGHLTTIEILPERVKLAKEHIGQAGLSHRVTFKEGDAHEVVPTLDGPFDFVFLDADKEGQVDYFKKLFPMKLPPGALLVAHNAIRFKEGMKDYLDLVGNHAEFDSVILRLTMEDGFSVSYRHRL